MSSTETLSTSDRATLLKVARASIAHGLQHHQALPVNAHDYPISLQPLRATFVTLDLKDRLRGCIGTLIAYQALVQDVAAHGYAAAFTDPRFPPVSAAEIPQLVISISILSSSQPLHFQSEEDLLNQLRPGQDGLILHFGQRRATFLPAVWESLPNPAMFLMQLKLKAGLPLDFWSAELRIERYTTDYFSETDMADSAH
jgi:AmmeMemoRadiSam system protein A